MNYKKLIKSRELRLKTLELLAFVPDRLMVKLQYRMKTGRKLNLKKPERFSEKLQWYKLNYKNPVMPQCVDKYDVREYVKSKGLEHILIPCIGVYDSMEQIPWDILPQQFVIKDTLGGGAGAFVQIVTDYEETDVNALKAKCSEWLGIDAHKKSGGREWPYYSGRNHRVIIEQYIESDKTQGGLVDFKFFCFNGKCHYIYVIADRELGNGAGLGIFDADFNRIEVQRADERPLEREIVKPENFSNMIQIAERLAEEFPEVRVDLYNVDSKILFGELTFFDGSGYMKFVPDEFDKTLGDCFVLPRKV